MHTISNESARPTLVGMSNSNMQPAPMRWYIHSCAANIDIECAGYLIYGPVDAHFSCQPHYL